MTEWRELACVFVLHGTGREEWYSCMIRSINSLRIGRWSLGQESSELAIKLPSSPSVVVSLNLYLFQPQLSHHVIGCCLWDQKNHIKWLAVAPESKQSHHVIGCCSWAPITTLHDWLLPLNLNHCDWSLHVSLNNNFLKSITERLWFPAPALSAYFREKVNSSLPLQTQRTVSSESHLLL